MTTFLYDFFLHMYYILLAALRQLVAIFCQRSSLPTEKELRRTSFPLSFAVGLGRISFSFLGLQPLLPDSFLLRFGSSLLVHLIHLIAIPYTVSLHDGGLLLDYDGILSPAGQPRHHQHADLSTHSD